MKKEDADKMLEWVANKSLEKSPPMPPMFHELVWQLFNAGREYEAYAESVGVDSFKQPAGDLIATLPHGDQFNIDFIHQIEQEIDKVLIPLGFSRTGTHKGEEVTMNYRQFGVATGE